MALVVNSTQTNAPLLQVINGWKEKRKKKIVSFSFAVVPFTLLIVRISLNFIKSNARKDIPMNEYEPIRKSALVVD